MIPVMLCFDRTVDDRKEKTNNRRQIILIISLAPLLATLRMQLVFVLHCELHFTIQKGNKDQIQTCRAKVKIGVGFTLKQFS